MFVFSALVLLTLSVGCGGNSSASSGGTTTPLPSTPPPVPSNEWTWMGGSDVSSIGNTSNQAGVYSTSTGVQVGVYGTKGQGATTNIPGARLGATSWTDSSGNFWLFGGGGFDANGADGLLNDLWEFSPTARTWTWVSGSSTSNANGGQSGVYGTQGTGAASNVPGGRFYALSWRDGQGNFWIFGGTGYDANGGYGALNDLWEFSPSANIWTWVSGANTLNSMGVLIGVYGTMGTPSATNVPGGRSRAVSWIDNNNNLWLFGGLGYDSTGARGALNDLWEFNSVSKNWIWVDGSSTTGNSGLGQPGVYGTKGTASASNIPGGRVHAVAWVDPSGNFWLFGGHGSDSTGSQDQMNDLWKFTPTAKTWTWVSGTNIEVTGGVYGTMGTASPNNFPGPRETSVSWTDNSGNLWLFGGDGFDANSQSGFLNDLWKFSPGTGEWTWVSGSETVGSNSSGILGQFGIYGTLGTPAATNVPGGRLGTVSWIDSSGNLWLFGGQGYGSSGAEGYLNDLWSYTP